VVPPARGFQSCVHEIAEINPRLSGERLGYHPRQCPLDRFYLASSRASEKTMSAAALVLHHGSGQSEDAAKTEETRVSRGQMSSFKRTVRYISD
jgi:hypothetical protein